VPEKHVREAFVPAAGLRGLDPELTSVREGMRLTFQLLRDMNAPVDIHPNRNGYRAIAELLSQYLSTQPCRPLAP
jgi:lysophospholipase L1-like esterase